MMLKEQITETYGEIRYTMSDGCSGGSIMQQSIASGYPGLLDGIQPNCSFPDTMTTGIEIADCGILQNNYYTTANGSAPHHRAAQRNQRPSQHRLLQRVDPVVSATPQPGPRGQLRQPAGERGLRPVLRPTVYAARAPTTPWECSARSSTRTATPRPIRPVTTWASSTA
jgi:hypothetical protein